MHDLNVLTQGFGEFEQECLAVSRSTLLPIIEKYDIKLLLTEPDNFDNLLFGYKNGKYLTEARAAKFNTLVNWGYWVDDNTIKITKDNVSIAHHQSGDKVATLVKDSKIIDIDVFAGPHPHTGIVKEELRDIKDLVKHHKETRSQKNPDTGKYEESKWYHAGGKALVWYENEPLTAEIHWFGHPDLDGARGRTAKYSLKKLWKKKHPDDK
ncbi:MAG: hypothetical protein FWG64_12790 [Firmicutes bacterium]|nr:hypothetical protein [Bacillota bacterium]